MARRWPPRRSGRAAARKEPRLARKKPQGYADCALRYTESAHKGWTRHRGTENTELEVWAPRGQS
jgi:hypothetical protein